jgi:sugar lactone lactonase YvrE
MRRSAVAITGRLLLALLAAANSGWCLDEKAIYWTFPGGDLYRVRLEDGRHERLLQGLTNPDGLAIDFDNRKLYWAENGKISQANLDGTNVELLVKGKTTQYSSLEIFPPAG